MAEIIGFSKLKAFLADGVPSCLVLFGKDDYLKKNSIDLIKKSLGLSMEDLNFCKIEEFDIERVLREANTLPFIDPNRLVVASCDKLVVKDTEKLNAYAKNPNLAARLVLVCGADQPKGLDFVGVDCNCLDNKTLENWIAVSSQKRKVVFEPAAATRLVDRTGGQMFRIRSEFEKLVALVGENGKVTVKMVDENVAAENEYQVFEFTDLVAKGKKVEALEMMNTIMLYERNIFGIWSALYSHFRRLFYAKITKASTKEIADTMGVKEYAIIKARGQAEGFRAVELKKILDIIAGAEENVKSGKMSQDLAIKTGLINILNTRG